MKKRMLKIVAVMSVLAIVLTIALPGAVMAAGNGTSSECAGPGLENQWGKPEDAGTGECLGHGYGESNEGAGPGLQNSWGKGE